MHVRSVSPTDRILRSPIEIGELRLRDIDNANGIPISLSCVESVAKC